MDLASGGRRRDSPWKYGGRAAFDDDAERALALWRSGSELLRFTHRQVHETPGAVTEAVAIALGRASARR